MHLADENLSYSDLVKAVSDGLSVSERTVKRRISELSEKGILVSRRKGKEVYYENSGLMG
ncbi:MAG: winged helix-turn-helix domain-containing protein [Thermoplasmata archaeon]